MKVLFSDDFEENMTKILGLNQKFNSIWVCECEEVNTF